MNGVKGLLEFLFVYLFIWGFATILELDTMKYAAFRLRRCRTEYV